MLLRDERQILVLAAVSLLQFGVQTLQLGRDLCHLESISRGTLLNLVF